MLKFIYLCDECLTLESSSSTPKEILTQWERKRGCRLANVGRRRRRWVILTEKKLLVIHESRFFPRQQQQPPLVWQQYHPPPPPKLSREGGMRRLGKEGKKCEERKLRLFSPHLLAEKLFMLLILICWQDSLTLRNEATRFRCRCRFNRCFRERCAEGRKEVNIGSSLLASSIGSNSLFASNTILYYNRQKEFTGHRYFYLFPTLTSQRFWHCSALHCKPYRHLFNVDEDVRYESRRRGDGGSVSNEAAGLLACLNK